MRPISWGCLGKFALFLSTGILRDRLDESLVSRSANAAQIRNPEKFHCGLLGRTARADLLNALFLGIPPNKRVEDCEDVTPVFHHPVEDIPEFGISLGVAVPLDHDRLRHFYVAAELFRRMAAQEQAVEKRRLALGKREVCVDFGCRNDLGNRGHKKNAVYRKAYPRQVVQAASCSLPGKSSTDSLTPAMLLSTCKPRINSKVTRFPFWESNRTTAPALPLLRRIQATPGLSPGSNRRRMLLGGSKFQKSQVAVK
jgi:hypothetical protein